jgi:LysM repeat protein
VAQTADIRAEVTVFDFTLLSPYELEIVAEMEIFGLQLLNAVKASIDDEAASSAGEQPEAVTDKAGYETVLVGYQPDNKEPEPSEEAEAADQEQDMIKQDERKSETENENTFVFRALAVGQEDPEQEKGSGGKERLNNVIHFRPNDQTVESRNKQEQEEKEAEQERAVSGESPMAGDGYAEKAGEPEESEASENDRDDVQSDQAVEAKIDDSSDFDREEGWEEDGQDVKVAITGKSIRETDEPLRVASFLQNKLLKQQEAQAETAENETDVEAVHPGIQTGKESAKKRQIEQFSSVKMRIVQRGDTWESIADYYQMDVAAIIKANGSQSELLEEGQVLIIPSSRRR